MDFKNINLRSELQDNIVELGFSTMTPIQEKGLPIILSGKDIIAQAKTGSGKTAVFSLKILNSLILDKLEIQSLILCPTRELAEQVAKETRMLARKLPNVKVNTLCGGVAEIHQEKSLKHGCHIIVGTPGRVLSMLQNKSLNLNKVKTFVLDEADRMLDMGFINAIRDIELYIPSDRQTLLFSATFPEEIVELGSSIQKDAEVLKVESQEDENLIEELFFEVEDHKAKNLALLDLLATYRPDRAIVFCKTKHITNALAKFLNRNGIVSAAINGDLLQNERVSVLTQFSNRSLSILVATDVAARGLDISELAAVVNFDLPRDPEIYIHRIGRTGRAGKKGLALTFVLAEEVENIKLIEEESQQVITTKKIEELNFEGEYDLMPPMKTLYINGGKKNKLRPGDILGAMVGAAEINASDVGNISIHNILSYVAVKRELANEVVKALSENKIKNRKFKVGLA